VIGLDTNVVVRYIMQDDPKQSSKVNQLMESLTPDAPGFFSLVSVVELVWVLSACYGLHREQVAQSIDALLRTKELVIDRAALVSQALRVFMTAAADFTDALIERASQHAGCSQTMTFDVGAAKAAGMALLK
jgi:predicted nucleic-acid-binding protein